MSETTTSPELEVPGEPGIFWCAKHKSVKTRLRCGRCEKPICPKCTRMGPTGARCPDCFSNKGSHIYQVSPALMALAFVASFALGVVGSYLVRLLFMLVFFAPVLGTVAGKAITSMTRGKRGTNLAIVASAGMAMGGLAPLALYLPAVPLFPLGIVLLYLALAIPALWWWIK